MADKGADVVSLARLIDHVYRFPWVLSRERFLGMQGSHDGFGLGDSWFESLAGTGDYIDPQIPAQDFDDLQTKTRSVRDWVNKSVAHLTSRPRTGPPLNDIHDAIDVVATLFRKYQTLIGGVTVQLGVIMEPWPSIFRVPWIPTMTNSATSWRRSMRPTGGSWRIRRPSQALNPPEQIRRTSAATRTSCRSGPTSRRSERERPASSSRYSRTVMPRRQSLLHDCQVEAS
jgi:hypothetical protein